MPEAPDTQENETKEERFWRLMSTPSTRYKACKDCQQPLTTPWMQLRGYCDACEAIWLETSREAFRLQYYGDLEHYFLAFVRSHAQIGYGRMMQIISHEWYRHDPDGAGLANTAYGLLEGDEARAYRSLAERDPLFRSTKE
jgi:hypothetical protein